LIASGVTEVGCLAHARRKFFDLHVQQQEPDCRVRAGAVSALYEIEREVKHLDR
jgi:transposase